MVKTGCFTPGDLKELFDKHVFLYYEEKILGQKLKQMGLKELLVTDAYYVHAHSVSIDKSYNKISDKQKLLHKSKLYYYQHYQRIFKTPVRNFTSPRTTARNAFATASSIFPSFR